jgi:hypothetical protein
MTDLTAAHEAAHEEHYDRTMKVWRAAKTHEEEEAGWRAWIELPRFNFHAVIALNGGGKVHRVFSPSRKQLDQPFTGPALIRLHCGSSRWKGGHARIVDSPVTCQKCLR